MPGINETGGSNTSETKEFTTRVNAAASLQRHLDEHDRDHWVGRKYLHKTNSDFQDVIAKDEVDEAIPSFADTVGGTLEDFIAIFEAWHFEDLVSGTIVQKDSPTRYQVSGNTAPSCRSAIFSPLSFLHVA